MCLEPRIDVPGGEEIVAALQKELFELGRQENQCDVALQKANVLRKAKRMIVFDLSWTLVQCGAIYRCHASGSWEEPAAGVRGSV